MSTFRASWRNRSTVFCGGVKASSKEHALSRQSSRYRDIITLCLQRSTTTIERTFENTLGADNESGLVPEWILDTFCGSRYGSKHLVGQGSRTSPHGPEMGLLLPKSPSWSVVSLQICWVILDPECVSNHHSFSVSGSTWSWSPSRCVE